MQIVKVMKPVNTLLALLFISLLSSPSWSATLGDLVERNGLYYEQFNSTPFTGRLTGDIQGSLKSGEREVDWVDWGKNRESFKGRYKNGKKEGLWIYWDNGRVRFKGRYKNGKEESAWVWYYENGQVRETSSFKDGVKISD